MNSFISRRYIAVACLSLVLLGARSSSGQGAPHLFDVVTDLPSATVGSFVLCPSRQFIDKALETGIEKNSFVFYAATLQSKGKDTCTVRNLAGSEFEVPNELVVWLGDTPEKVEAGDILLTWWQSGSGMQRAMVVGGSSEEPVVRYLDVDLENPSGVGKREDKLRPNSFVKLEMPWQVGSSVAHTAARPQRVGQLIWLDKDSVIVREFAGRLKKYPRKDVTPIPIVPELSVGDAAQAQLFGSLKPVTVESVDEKIGRVFCTYQFGRTEKQKAFPFGEITQEIQPK